LLQVAETNECPGCIIQALALQATVLQTQGATAQALPLLKRALFLAEPEGFIRTFLDEGAPMITLLRELVQRERWLNTTEKVSLTYVHHLLSEAGVQIVLERKGTCENAQSAPEILSERELEILHLIAAGLSNQEIRQRLVIATSTLKTHINHIYSKLDVRSRTQAIVQARRLRLL
ncbi:MAG: hypothetical protein JO031_17635, partial [Ktedonobacteraceae bacterium]|nr:hypothetical protein [Ktedonobacteraceae bacterium]